MSTKQFVHKIAFPPPLEKSVNLILKIFIQFFHVSGNKNGAFGKPCLCPRDIFVIFVVSRGLSSKALVLLVRTQIRHFRRFRQNPLFFWRDKGTVYQKHRFLDPEYFDSNILSCLGQTQI